MLSLILWSILGLTLAPAMSHTVEGEAQLIIRDIDNPLYGPSNRFAVEFLIADLPEDLYAFEFTITYDPTNLEAMDIQARYPYKTLVSMVPPEVPDGTAYLLADLRELQDPLGPGDDLLSIGYIMFHVIDRCQCVIGFADSVLYTSIGGVLVQMDHHTHGGMFDNRLEGLMKIPPYAPASYEPGTLFRATVYVDAPAPIHKSVDLWGVEATVTWDPNVLAILPFPMLEDGFTMILAQDYGPDFAYFAVSQPFGSLGVEVPDEVAVVSFDFVVLDWGTTSLSIEGEELSDAFGNKLVLDPAIDGWMANTGDIACALDTMFIETQKFRLSQDPEGLQTLTAQIKNVGAGWTQVLMYFDVYDELGDLVDTATVMGSIAPGQTMRLSQDVDVTGHEYEAFSVETSGWYFMEGEWTLMNKGAPGAAKYISVKHFTVEP